MGFLRYLLAITVVIAHSKALFGLTLVGSEIAVQSFYIISGFYMTLVLNEKYIGDNSSYFLFIKNRFLRLYPFYWLMLFLTILASFVFFIKTDGENFGRLQVYIENFGNLSFGTLLFLFFINFFLFFQDLVMFMGVNSTDGSLYFTFNFSESNPPLHFFLLIPQAWTVSVELTFYLIAPFLMRRKYYIILVLIFLSLILRLFLQSIGLDKNPWTYRFFPTELVFFLLGYISYKIYFKIKNIEMNQFINYTLFSLVILMTLFFDKIIYEHKKIAYFLIFFTTLPFVFNFTKKWKYDNYIGELSYPIYISHILIYYVFQGLNIANNEYIGLILILTSSFFSIFLIEVIGKKVEKLRQEKFAK
jgi:peptidoglycan/LPS O-acetylase OafA/YrhL